MQLGNREIAAVLAGLRLLQAERATDVGLSEDIYNIATDGLSFAVLNDVEIDALAEYLNTGNSSYGVERFDTDTFVVCDDDKVQDMIGDKSRR